MPTLVTTAIVVFLGLGILGWLYPNLLQFLNFLILGFTLIVLIWYAYDTHRIAGQTLESNLRPVVLRSGYIPNWDSLTFAIQGNTVSGTPIGFRILKNIAKSISGHIILKNRKYTLLFGNPISSITTTSAISSSTQQLIAFDSIWGWLAPDNTLSAIFNPTQFQTIDKDNEIYIQYQDIEGNKYFTLEDKNFLSTSGSL